MKRVCLAVFTALISPASFAGSAGGPVSQVIPEPPPPTVGPVTVQFQESVPLQIRANIAGVSVGSSRIANVAVHDAHTVLISGQSYGTTSLHIFDNYGNVVVDTVIHVVDRSPSRLTVNRGGSDFSMSCSPNCRAAPNVGDNPDYYEAVLQQGQAASQ